MSPVHRYHTGTATIPSTLLNDIDWTLDMDTAEPPDVVKAVAARIQAGEDVDEDNGVDGGHSWLQAVEVDTVQPLRADATAAGDRTTVDASYLSQVQNLFDTLTLTFNPACDEEAADPDDPAPVRALIAADGMCYRCQWCRFLVMRDRIDAQLDAQGFEGPAYYEPYVPGGDVEDPEVVWRTKVMASPVLS
jgi:hypothetical protein